MITSIHTTIEKRGDEWIISSKITRSCAAHSTELVGRYAETDEDAHTENILDQLHWLGVIVRDPVHAHIKRD